MSISKILRDLREDSDLSQSELAKKLRINQSTLSLYEKGERTPTYENLLALANYYDVSLDYLTGRDIDINVSPIEQGETLRIPVLGSIPAGIPIPAVEDVVEEVDIPVEWTKGGKEYFGLLVTGDSMEPEYQAGDTVIVQIKPDCETGDDAVCFVNGYNATLKRVKKIGNRIILQPLNPKYEPTTYGPGDKIRIAGVVKELRRKK